jgi:hypothetical protein
MLLVSTSTNEQEALGSNVQVRSRAVNSFKDLLKIIMPFPPEG